MKIGRVLSYVCIFFAGAILGVVWTGLAMSRVQPDRATSGKDSTGQSPRQHMTQLYGEEMSQFASQFDEMTTHVQEYPFNASASPDGRFVIRLFGSEESMASDLRCPDGEGVGTELNRHYYFACGGRTYAVDFGRTEDDSRVTRVQFSCTDGTGSELSYADLDADGRWDVFIHGSDGAKRIYDRDGLSWKARVEAPPTAQRDSMGQ